jgi:hypothetical protein
MSTVSTRRAKVIYQSGNPIEIVREGQDYFIYTDELPANFFHMTDVYLEVEVDMGDIKWSAYGIRFNNPLEVSLETMDSVQQKRV